MNTSLQPVINSVEIIYQDDLLVVVNKPNNFLIHQSHYARNIDEPTLLEVLEKQLGFQLFPIHRLDRKTSGIILLLKDKSFINQFQELFTKNEIEKTYYAIARGFSPAEGIIDSPVKNDDTGVYKAAITKYKSIHQVELQIPVHPYASSRYSLIELKPQTGRMHQLRKHLNKISHPIVGDYKYGDRFHNRMFEQKLDCIYMFLHAYSIKFIHPLSHQKMNFTANFPDDWVKVMKQFKWKL